MSINNPFPNHDLSVLDCDKFGVEFIDPEMLQLDISLFETKWWDYRTMHPTQATAYFYTRYRIISAEYITKYVDSMRGAKAKMDATRGGLTNLKKKHAIRGFWKARQAADAIGMPYDMYIRVVLDNFFGNYHLFATTKGGRQDLPYAAQLTSKTIISKALREWEETKALPNRMVLPESDAVLNQRVWFRPEMEKALLTLIKGKDHPRNMAGHALKIGAIIRAS